MIKIIKKEKARNGRRRIYIFGMKVLSYKRHKRQLPVLDPRFYQCCDIPNIENILKNGNLIDHPIGIVISQYVTLGRGNRIYQNVTIGAASVAGYVKKEYPIIGDNNVFGAGCVVVGKIKIGSNCVIAANAVVTKNVPDNTMVMGIAPTQKYTKIPDNYYYTGATKEKEDD